MAASESGPRTGRRMRIIAFAYACEPVKGSEPAAGWVLARMLARFADVWVVTRENNRYPIESAITSIPERDHLRFEYFDLPSWTRRWKRGARGARIYYALWQVGAVRRGRRLAQDVQPEIVWHLTWGNAWLGTLAPFLPYRFIYGPVGGGTGMAWGLLRTLGLRGCAFEFARTSVRVFARYLNPFARLAWRRADVILVQNPETRDWLPRRHRPRTVVFPHAVLEEDASGSRAPLVRRGQLTALYAGRLVPWKGVALAIHSLVHLPDWRLLICGTGSDEMRLKRLAGRLGVDDRTQFLGWLPRERVRTLMTEEADVFVFPSLHDDAPFAVAEALTLGLPVVCLDRGGPPVLGGTPVRASRAEPTIEALGEAMKEVSGGSSSTYPDMRFFTRQLRSIVEQRIPEVAGAARSSVKGVGTAGRP